MKARTKKRDLRRRKRQQYEASVVANAASRKRRTNPLRVDPTRTAGLRRRFLAEMRRRFSGLKVAIIKKLVDEDALGLKETSHDPFTSNAFCATGEGGGVDPSCGSSSNDSGYKVREPKVSGDWVYLEVEDSKGNTLEGGTSHGKLEMSLKGSDYQVREVSVREGLRGRKLGIKLYEKAIEYAKSQGKGLRSDTATSDSADKVWQSLQRKGYAVKRADQTELDKGLNKWYAVKQIEVLGNKPLTIRTGEPVWRLTTNAGEWRFHSDPAKVKAFQDWLRTQVRVRILKGEEDKLWQAYIEAGFRKGQGRAFDDTNVAKRAAATDQSRMNFYAGTREEFLRSSFNRPVAVEKVKLLAGRSFDDLENVTDDMSARMSRHLVDGLIQGKGPREIARDMVEDVDISRSRAETIARTEIIRAHAEGQLTALEDMGVEEVGVAVEWITAQDEAVCPLCASLEGVILKIEEARGLLPRHVNCRCAWLPANVNEDDKGSKDTKAKIESAFEEADVDREVDADRPRSTVLNREMALLDRWLMGNAFCATGEGGGVDPSCSSLDSAFEKEAGLSDGGNKELKLPIADGVKPAASCGKFGDCTNQAFKEYKRSGADVYHGYAVRKDRLEDAKRMFTKEGWATPTEAVPHAWNVKDGKIVDKTFGSDDAKRYVYYGKQVPKSVLDSMKHGDEIAALNILGDQ